MEKLFLFAIGGTGARVLRSFTMLLASGQDIMKNYDVYPIILDYDETNGDTAIATRCIEHYNKIHQSIWKDKRLTQDNLGYFKSNLCHLGKDDNEFGASSFKMIYAPKGDKVFKNYIDYDQLGQDDVHKIDTTNTHLLMQSLYNTDPVSVDAEMNLKMDVGFKGNPNIGSLVFHDIDKECVEFSEFLSRLNTNDKVMVVGSLFGGTGSSGIPEIIRKIHSKAPTVKVGAILVMPYFAPKSRGAIRPDIFNSKTKASINYYEASGLIDFDTEGKRRGGMLNSVYFVGDPKPTGVEYCDGGIDQKNPANITEFISALCILNYAAGNEGCFKYGVGQYITGNDVSVSNLIYKDLYRPNDFVEPIFKRFTSFTVAMKYFMFRTLQPDRSLRRTSYYSRFTLDNPRDNMKTLLSELQEFWKEYKEWLDEMSNNNVVDKKGNSHSLTLFSTEPNMEILLVNTGKDEESSSPRSRRQKNKSVDESKIDAMINSTIKEYEKGAGTGGNYITKDEEYLFMQGLYQATINKEDIIEKLFAEK